MNRTSCGALAVAAALLFAVQADAQKSGRPTKDERREERERRKEDKKRQKEMQRRGERKDRDCSKEMGPGAVWSAAQNKCLPPKPETPRPKAKPAGSTLPKGGTAPAKAQPPVPRGMGESCGMVANTMLSCRAPFVCTGGKCAAPARAETSGVGGKCGPSGGRFIRCAAGLKCAAATNTCVATAAAPTTPKPRPAAATTDAVKTVRERAICGSNIKDNAGKLWRFDCQAGLVCKPLANFPGRGTCQKPETAKAEEKKKEPEKKEPEATKGAPPIVSASIIKEYNQCSLEVKFSAPAGSKDIKLYYARPGSPPYNREWDESPRWRDDTAIKVGGGSADCGGLFKFKLCASYKVTDYQDEERCTPVQTKQAPPKD